MFLARCGGTRGALDSPLGLWSLWASLQTVAVVIAETLVLWMPDTPGPRTHSNTDIHELPALLFLGPQVHKVFHEVLLDLGSFSED